MPFTLEFVSGAMEKGLDKSDDALQASINSVGDGTSISVPQMVKLQTQMSQYTICAGICSSCVKECGDCMKGVLQKIS